MLKKALKTIAVSSLLFSAAAYADYPDRTIELIVPYTPGGTADGSARALAKALESELGEAVVVVNRPGGGTLVGTSFVARSKPDGYTLKWAVAPFAINHTLFEEERDYDTFDDFQPVTHVISVPLVLTVNKDTPVHDFEEFLEWAKSDGPLTFGSAGNGGTTHLAPEMLAAELDLDFTHVPYRGSAPAMNDLMAGQVDFFMDTVFLVPPQAGEDGRLRMLAQSGATRSPAIPDVPTLQELGVEGFDVATWYSLVAPADTPREVVEKLNAAVNKALEDPELRDFYTSQGAIVVGGSIEDAENHLATEVEQWAEAIEISGAKADN